MQTVACCSGSFGRPHFACVQLMSIQLFASVGQLMSTSFDWGDKSWLKTTIQQIEPEL